VGSETMPGIHGFCSFYPFGAICGKPLLRLNAVFKSKRQDLTPFFPKTTTTAKKPDQQASATGKYRYCALPRLIGFCSLFAALFVGQQKDVARPTRLGLVNSLQYGV